MKLRAELGKGMRSLEEVRAMTGIARPASFRNVLARFRAPIVFDEPLVTPGGVALGGHHTITLERNGDCRHSGFMRATGFPSFTFGVRTVVRSDAGPLLFSADGRVHGTNESGNRQSNFDIRDHNGLIALNWGKMHRARTETAINRSADFFGTLGDVLGFAGSLAAGAAVAGASGVCLVLGVRAADLAGAQIGIAGLAGVTVTGGTLLVLGPGAIVPAIIAGAAAGAAAEIALRHRPMRADERAFADQVFKGSVPFERVQLTNMLGFGGRAFTMPSVGETILVNIGTALDDPVHHTGGGDPHVTEALAPGQLLIHELTHAWQIAHARFLPGLLCEMIPVAARRVGAAYGPPDQPFSEFNPEEEAFIVDDWFGGSGGQDRFEQMQEGNPYFRYIRDNIRARIP
jgi:hypothetical protein